MMASQRKCRACGKPFHPDYRNAATQAFCPQPECRRARRAKSQRHRRDRARQGNSITRQLKPSEALWLHKNPMIIGLISVLIGSTDIQDIEAFCAAASLRGRKIVDGTLVDAAENLLENQARKQ